MEHDATTLWVNNQRASGERRPIVVICAAVLIFSVLSCYCSVRSEGFIAADACTHYLYARFAIREPTRLVDVWARPLVTALYAVPAALGGRLAVRAVCLVVALACGFVAMAIGRRQGLRLPLVALLFTLGQPMLFLHSFGEMTELPFALLLGLAFMAYQRERYVLVAALIALTPLARPEGFGFVLIAAFALWMHHRRRAILLLPIPLLLWNICGWLITEHRGPMWRWLLDAWPYAGQSLYGNGHLLTFVGQLPAIVSPLVLPATLVGIVLSLARAGRKLDHSKICKWLTSLIPLFVLAVHTLLYWSGKLASFGEGRYLLVVAPFWGVLSARGWEWIFDRFSWRYAARWASIAVLAPPVVINLLSPAVPVGLSGDWETARQFADWYKSIPKSPGSSGDVPHIMAAHPGIFYFLDISPCDWTQARGWDSHNASTIPPATALIWDPIYADKNASADHALRLENIRRAGWIELRGVIQPLNATTPAAINASGEKAADDHQLWHVFISPN